MLKFEVYRDGALAEHVNLSGAYLFGQDGIPVRADIVADDGQIRCIKRFAGPCGLSLLWPVGEAGALMLPTTRLPERDKPYNLHIELARARIMKLMNKVEDWGLFDYEKAESFNAELDEVRRQFIAAVNCDNPAESARLADEVLDRAVILGEKMALFHSKIFLERRRQNSKVAPVGFGCVVDLYSASERYRQRLAEAFDFIVLPMTWKHLITEERTYKWEHVDDWVNWAVANKRPIHAGPLVSFDSADVPEWLYLWEHDYESLREMIYEHIQSVVQRYGQKVRLWKVVSGLNAYNSFNLSFEQIMELTRMCCSLVKKLAPRSIVLIDLVCPWGEYYARNQRTIPPMLYASMIVQSGIKFDSFGVQIYMGVPQDGMYVRDLLQISVLLDEFVAFGVPLEITGIQVPSGTVQDTWDAWGGKFRVEEAGNWHGPWTPRLQAEWLEAFCRIALSKPFIGSVCWRDLADYEGHYLPHGGLCKSNLQAKLAFRQLKNLRTHLRTPSKSASTGKAEAEW